MALIQPFRALRFTGQAGDPAALTCPPYDIISEAQRQAYLAANPNNIIRLELPREGADPYAAAGDTLTRWLADGTVARDAVPGIYIYQEAFSVGGRDYAVKGFVCRVHLEEFSKGIVLPHEETLSGAKEDRFRLMCATGCNFSQIYALYPDDGDCDAMLDALSAGTPDQEFTDAEGVTHRLWIVPDSDPVRALCAAFREKKLYIADGHHRYETALRYRDHLRAQGLARQGEDADFVMMCLVSLRHPGLVVLPTHRIVRDLPAFDQAATLEKCAPFFWIRPLPDAAAAQAALKDAYAAGEKAFVLYAGDYTLLVLKKREIMKTLLPAASPALRQLDVSILHGLVLERLFGIDKANMAAQKNLTYTRDPQEAVAAVDSGNANCAFLLNPTRVAEIRDVAAAGEKMPQKSTYFYPKLITGLVMNQLRDI